MEKYTITLKDTSTPSGDRSFEVVAGSHLHAAMLAIGELYPDLVDQLRPKRRAGDYRCDGQFQAFKMKEQELYGEPFDIRLTEEEPRPLGPRFDWRQTAGKEKTDAVPSAHSLIELRYQNSAEFDIALIAIFDAGAALDVDHYRVPGMAYLLVNRARARHVAGILRRAGMISGAMCLEENRAD